MENNTSTNKNVNSLLAPVVMANYERTYNLILLGIVDYNGHKTILNEAINWAKHWINMANEIEEMNRNGKWLKNDWAYFFQAKKYFENLLVSNNWC
jgi:hypothetical protein